MRKTTDKATKILKSIEPPLTCSERQAILRIARDMYLACVSRAGTDASDWIKESYLKCESVAKKRALKCNYCGELSALMADEMTLYHCRLVNQGSIYVGTNSHTVSTGPSDSDTHVFIDEAQLARVYTENLQIVKKHWKR